MAAESIMDGIGLIKGEIRIARMTLEEIQIMMRANAREASAFIRAETIKRVTAQSKQLQKMLEQLKNAPK